MQAKLKLLGLLLVAALTVAGCDDDGGGGGTPDADAGTGDTGGDATPDTTPDATPDGTPDATPDQTPDAPEFDSTEVEPNDETPQEITVPGQVRGQVGEPTFDPEIGEIPDFDVFAFDATAGDVLSLTVSELGIEPFIRVQSAEGTEPLIFREITAETEGQTRQLFIPATGTYELIVTDIRNLADEVVGGDEFTYVVDIADAAAADAGTITVGGEVESVTLEHPDLPEGNAVRIYELVLEEAGLLVIDVDALTKDPASDFDGAVVIMSDDLSEFIAENDDEDVGAGLYDPYLRHNFEEAGTYALVLDYFWAGADNFSDVTVTLADPGEELEPNDSPTTAWPLEVVEAEGADSPVIGTIGEPTEDEEGAEIPDFDYYALGEVLEGDTVTVTVTPGESSELEPRLFVGLVVDGFFGPEFIPVWSSRPHPDGTASIDATAVETGEWFAIVADDRNFAPEDADEEFELDAVGGTDFDYAITAEEAGDRTIEALTLPAADGPNELNPGEVHWYSFSTPSEPEGFLVISSAAVELDLLGYLFDATEPEEGDAPPVGPFVDSGAGFLVLTPTPDTDHQLALFNVGEWPSSVDDYTLNVELANPTPVAEGDIEGDDYGDTAEAATTVLSLPVAYEGEVTGTNEADGDADVFELELTAGDTIVALAYGPHPEPEGEDDPVNADVVLTLSSTELEEPIEIDSAGAGGEERLDFEVPAEGAGTYHLAVTAYCFDAETCDFGGWGVVLFLFEAPPGPAE